MKKKPGGVSPEEIEKARSVDLLAYLRECDPGELVHVSGEPRQPEDQQRSMDVVFAGDRGLECTGLSHKGEKLRIHRGGKSDKRTGGQV